MIEIFPSCLAPRDQLATARRSANRNSFLRHVLSSTPWPEFSTPVPLIGRSSALIPLRCVESSKRWIFRALTVLLLTVLGLTGCAESTKQNENLAAQRAIEFARIVLVNKDFDQGYELLSDGGKRHISLAKFQETMIRLHPGGFPSTVTAKEYQPMPGENALWIYLNGQNPETHYRLTMEATASGDYKVLTIDSGAVGRMFSSGSEKKELSQPFSTAH